MNQTQWAELWIKEGGNPDKADEASAVVMAESGGRPRAHTPGSCCFGGYQFHKDYFDVKCANEPACATRLAIKVSKQGTDWGAWEAHTNGAYKKFLGKSKVGNIGFDEDCKPLGGSHLENMLAGGIATGAAGSIVPGIGTAAGFAGGAALGAAGAFLGGNLLGGCSPIEGANPLEGIDRLAAAVEAIARLIENMFTAHFWVRFGKGLLGALLLVYALQGLLKTVIGTEIPIGPANAFLKGKIAAAAGQGG